MGVTRAPETIRASALTRDVETVVNIRPAFFRSPSKTVLVFLVFWGVLFGEYPSNKVWPGRFEIVIGTDVFGPLPRLFQAEMQMPGFISHAALPAASCKYA